MEKREDLENYIKQAMEELYQEDFILLKDNVSERCLVYNFARRLEKILDQTEYKELNIDLEYNRNCSMIKSLKNQKVTYPDLILHERGNNAKNTIAIEFKKWNNKNHKILEKDRKKLKGFKYEYGYKLCLLIIFSPKHSNKVIYELQQ